MFLYLYLYCGGIKNMENKIVNAGIRLTRNCNMKCMYCNIQNTVRDELDLKK